MGRKRSTHLNLPVRMKARVRSSGTYFYYFTGSKELPLGSDYVAAVQKWAEYEGGNTKATNIITFRYIAEKYSVGPWFEPRSGSQPQSQYRKDWLFYFVPLFGGCSPKMLLLGLPAGVSQYARISLHFSPEP